MPARRSESPGPRREAAAAGAKTRHEPPGTAKEALGQARDHLRVAAAESLAAARSLLDAAALATAGTLADSHKSLGPLARGLDELAGNLAAGERLGSTPLFEAVLDALDSEIGRWEVRSRRDDDARAVLRAFLGLREILWEFGVRPGGAGERQAAPDHPAPSEATEPAPDQDEDEEPKAAEAARAPRGSRGAVPPRRTAQKRPKRETPERRPPPRVQRIEVQ